MTATTTRKGARGEGGHTPVMRQYLRAKAQYPDAIVFFRLGDFYEMFFEDAVVASEVLGLTLTSRNKDAAGENIPMAGVPHHAAAGYIADLLGKGHSVALCEQMADPSTVKGVVPREVVRVVTPGLCLDPGALEARCHNFLVAVTTGGSGELRLALAALELSTAELRVATFADEVSLLAAVQRLEPREILFRGDPEFGRALGKALPHATVRPPLDGPENQEERRASLFQRVEASSDVLAQMTAYEGALRDAVGSALAYAAAMHPSAPLTVERVVQHLTTGTLVLDGPAIQNLELVRTLQGERRGSLLHLIDHTMTAMGARLLRERLLAPSADLGTIRRRHDAVQSLVTARALRRDLREVLRSVGDLERMTTRAVYGLATPRDLGEVRAGLRAAERIRALLTGGTEAAALEAPALGDVEPILQRLQNELVADPPPSPAAGGVIAEGVSAELDELRQLASSAKDLILAMEARERDATGIPSLKIKFTRVFGYYIEVTKANLRSVPERYRRKQTIANGERFTTDELDDLQAKALGAEERAHALEADGFASLRSAVASASGSIHRLAHGLAEMDVHAALAEVAEQHRYVRPRMDDGLVLQLTESRHPVVEHMVARGVFVPNDVRIDADHGRLLLITGPNMAGKSTVMRQVALSVILAQAGSFVPASQAHIGLVDRIHTRVGASDNLSAGQSTFMVEMTEAATILRQATRRSLVILDEVGRGTSTYDGLALAQAIAEHLHDAVRCRTMFATHFHELCQLAETREGVMNANVTAEERDGNLAFFHRLRPGSASKSYGIEVARHAGIPEVVLGRARAVLAALEAPSEGGTDGVEPVTGGQGWSEQAEGVDDALRVAEALKGLDLDRTTPFEALLTLARLRAMVERK